ncbi:MFS transporter [Arthrobacter sp. ISL-48]|uniref:MFS transporter n=1 Tax=Arthrobacter sp. ISL-48 TaxID=2819110 RepID=UPI0037C172CF
MHRRALGFAFGTPLGAWIGTTFGWRWSFGALSVLAVIVVALIIVCVPDAAGQPATSRLPLGQVFRIPGVAIILAAIVAWMLAHSTIYTYIAPISGPLKRASRPTSPCWSMASPTRSYQSLSTS